jgi:hypothetical protein
VRILRAVVQALKLIAGDRNGDFAQMPFAAALRRPPPDPVSKFPAEFARPPASVSWLTPIPRAASISSIMRKLSKKRK